MDQQALASMIKRKAVELGFMYCAISEASFLEDEAPRLERWLSEGRHGDMRWMENHFDKRLDPRKLVPGAKSVISFALNYFPEQTQPEGVPRLAKYAYGRDYHKVIKNKLKGFAQWLKDEVGAVEGRYFVDSAPVMDKAWAVKSGIGWMGKNTNVIAKKAGSFFFLAEFISDLNLVADGPIKDYCGTCTRCLDACPTGALDKAYEIDGSKCISYFTIELKDAIPDSQRGKFNDWMFGCDICQDVCPWNRLSKPHNEPDFNPHEALFGMSRGDWLDITEDVFEMLFEKSAVKRTQYSGLKRNLAFLDSSKKP